MKEFKNGKWTEKATAAEREAAYWEKVAQENAALDEYTAAHHAHQAATDEARSWYAKLCLARNAGEDVRAMEARQEELAEVCRVAKVRVLAAEERVAALPRSGPFIKIGYGVQG